MQKDLLLIEKELQELMRAEVRTWQRTAQILLQVRDEKLYEGQAESFTQWVRLKAEQFNIHESAFWRVLKAGSFYLSIRNTDDRQVLQEAKATPDQLDLVSKITQYAPLEVKQSLVEQAISGNLNRGELRRTWQNYREAAGHLQHYGRNLPNDIASFKKSNCTFPDTELMENRLTAANIFEALAKPENQKEILESHANPDEVIPYPERIVYSDPFREVAVRPGTTRSARRIDVVWLTKQENAPFPIIYGIEVKVSRRDLQEDKKLSEYFPFCHFFFLAIPANEAFTQEAKAVTTSAVGILAVDDKLTVRVVRSASQLPAPKVGETYGSLLQQAIQWHRW